ncbi:peroxide stress protein YaaA [Corynebacterium deserti]|nr:peroxide stress protein YaaA [Corynebacterium deserti]
MLIVLPPSETKTPGGAGEPLDFERLSFPQLTSTRTKIAADLQALKVEDALKILGISDNLRSEAEANTHLFTSPTMPAIFRYSGVLYDALDATTLPPESLNRLAIGSALFGVVRATDPIPHYRLSGGTKIPTATGELPTLKARWGNGITEALIDENQLVIDLRSGTYQQLGRLKNAVTVRVESVLEDGSRKVVSHFNKHYKGELARVLAVSAEDAHDAADVMRIALKAGLVIEDNPNHKETLTMVV